MISVIRTPLDNGVWAVATATKGTTYIAVDAQHITPTGARALERVLNEMIEDDPGGAGAAPRAA